jgi:hypothetical protein
MWALPNRKAKQIFAGLQHNTGAGQRYLARRGRYFLVTVQVSNGSPVRRRSPAALVYMSSSHGRLPGQTRRRKKTNAHARTTWLLPAQILFGRTDGVFLNLINFAKVIDKINFEVEISVL